MGAGGEYLSILCGIVRFLARVRDVRQHKAARHHRRRSPRAPGIACQGDRLAALPDTVRARTRAVGKHLSILCGLDGSLLRIRDGPQQKQRATITGEAPGRPDSHVKGIGWRPCRTRSGPGRARRRRFAQLRKTAPARPRPVQSKYVRKSRRSCPSQYAVWQRAARALMIGGSR